VRGQLGQLVPQHEVYSVHFNEFRAWETMRRRKTVAHLFMCETVGGGMVAKNWHSIFPSISGGAMTVVVNFI
jgi:hypothetical protein